MYRTFSPNFAGRRLAAALGALIVALTLVVALPGQAEASAVSCDFASTFPESCVEVVGTGTWVETAAGGIVLLPRQSARGHFKIWGNGFSVSTAAAVYWNQNWILPQTMWGPTFRIARNLPANSTVCAQFIDSAVGARPPACVRIG